MAARALSRHSHLRVIEQRRRPSGGGGAVAGEAVCRTRRNVRPRFAWCCRSVVTRTAIRRRRERAVIGLAHGPRGRRLVTTFANRHAVVNRGVRFLRGPH
jgi:hypothetical protein